MPRKRRHEKQRRAEVAPSTMAFFRDDPNAYSYLYFLTAAEVAMQWAEVRDEIIEEWVIAHPGSRPRTWWAQNAPSPRRRIGGTGQPLHEVSAYVENYKNGLLADWVTARWHGKGVAVDPENPPLFESQATYLQRLALLLPGELGHPALADFEPEAVEIAEE